MRDDDDQSSSIPWRTAVSFVVATIGVTVLPVTGYLLGDTLTTLRQEIRDLRTIVESRAGLASRLDAIEKGVNSNEHRIETLEHAQWKQGGQR